MDTGGYEHSAHLYDLFDRKENIAFFAHYGAAAGEVLDVGAGTGRIAIPLAQEGIKVFCVEPSPAMRREFQSKLRQRPELAERIVLVDGDAASFRFHRTFRAAYLPGVFDHFLNDQARVAALDNIGRHLETGGTLVFDVFLGLMRDAPLSPAGAVHEGQVEHRRFVGARVLPDGTMETVLVFETYRSGRLVDRVEEKSLVGLIDRGGLQRLLEANGFRVRREFCDYQFTAYREGALLLVVEAEKVRG